LTLNRKQWLAGGKNQEAVLLVNLFLLPIHKVSSKMRMMVSFFLLYFLKSLGKALWFA